MYGAIHLVWQCHKHCPNFCTARIVLKTDGKLSYHLTTVYCDTIAVICYCVCCSYDKSTVINSPDSNDSGIQADGEQRANPDLYAAKAATPQQQKVSQ